LAFSQGVRSRTTARAKTTRQKKTARRPNRRKKSWKRIAVDAAVPAW